MPNDTKKIGGRPKKSEKYKKEREEIINKLNVILGITNDNKKFYIWDIDNNEDKQKQIIHLKDDVEKYFRSKDSSIFIKENVKRAHLAIIKIIYKEMNHKLSRVTKTIIRNEKSIQSACYLIDVE